MRKSMIIVILLTALVLFSIVALLTLQSNQKETKIQRDSKFDEGFRYPNSRENLVESVCGDGIIGLEENSQNCCEDVGCTSGEECINNECVMETEPDSFDGEPNNPDEFPENDVALEEDPEEVEEELKCFGNLCKKKTLILLANFIDYSTEPLSRDEVVNQFFNLDNPNSTNSYLYEASFEKDWLKGDVFGWLTLPVTSENCESYLDRAPNIYNLTNEVDPEIDFSLYDKIFVLYPKEDCSVGARGYYNVKTQTEEGIFNFSIVVKSARNPNNFDSAAVHELGHGIGLQHATVFECGEESIGVLGENCEIEERGNQYDIMGVSGFHGHFNAFYKEQLGWFEESNVLEATNSGEYLLEPLEKSSEGLQMIKIPVQYDLEYNYQSTHYFVEYRQPIGFDANFEELDDVSNGVLIYLASEPANTLPYRAHLLDMTPHITSENYLYLEDNRGPFLKLGETFVDEDKGISITFSEVSEEGAIIEVNI